MEFDAIYETKNCNTERKKERQKTFFPFWCPAVMEALTSKDDAAKKQRWAIWPTVHVVPCWVFFFFGTCLSIYIQQRTHIAAGSWSRRGFRVTTKPAELALLHEVPQKATFPSSSLLLWWFSWLQMRLNTFSWLSLYIKYSNIVCGSAVWPLATAHAKASSTG